MVFRFGEIGTGILISAPSFKLADEIYSDIINDLNDGLQAKNRKFKKAKHIVKIS